MRRNVRLVIAYDGTDFHGWQRQPGLRTVQGEVEGIIRRVCGEPVVLFGASRTDAGVHARGQVAHFFDAGRIPVENLRRAIGHRMPEDAAIIDATEAPEGFHAARDARSKLYRYRVFASERRPVEELAQRYTYHVWHRLDAERMRAAAAGLVGRHDFAGFATSGDARASTVRTVLRAEVARRGAEIQFDFEGDGFLYNQVRNMVGTLIEVGRGHWPVERIAEIIAARDRRLAGPTAPARGLCLEWIRYGAPGASGAAGAAGDESGAAGDESGAAGGESGARV